MKVDGGGVTDSTRVYSTCNHAMMNEQECVVDVRVVITTTVRSRGGTRLPVAKSVSGRGRTRRGTPPSELITNKRNTYVTHVIQH